MREELPAPATHTQPASTECSETVDIYTDGACKGNPGVGGWGVLMQSGARSRELYGGEPATTNNRMELMAVIRALEALKRPSSVRLHTDSQYVQLGISKWIHGWKKNGWKTADKKPVKNADLWRELDEVAARHDVEWLWVKGHAGHDPGRRISQQALVAQASRLQNDGSLCVLDARRLNPPPLLSAASTGTP